MSTPTYPHRTARLELRPFTDKDLDVLYAMHGDEGVSRYLYGGPRSRDQVRELLERIKPLTAIDEERDGIRLAAVLPESGMVIGDVSLWRTSRQDAQAEMGFIVLPEYQGRGYATEASAALLRLGFEAGIHRVIARADARNIASARVMQRLGMRHEALFRENELIKGEWCDEVVYAILAAEWQARGI